MEKNNPILKHCNCRQINVLLLDCHTQLFYLFQSINPDVLSCPRLLFFYDFYIILSTR